MKKVLTICMVAMLALGLMGFGFAKWSDTVAINTTVNTGNVLIGINDAGTTDPYDGDLTYLENNTNPALYSPGWDRQYWNSTFGEGGLNHEGKDVGSIDSTNLDPITGQTGWYKSIKEEIKNAYPYYKPGTTIEIASLGTVPVKIEGFSYSWTGPLADNIHCVDTVITYPNGTTDTVNGWDELVTAIEGVQLHQGQKITINLNMYFDQQSEMLADCTGTFTVIGSQWNEITIADPSI